MKLMLLKKQHIRVDVASKKQKTICVKWIWLKENSSLLNWVWGING
jgi:hypothetical protein